MPLHLEKTVAGISSSMWACAYGRGRVYMCIWVCVYGCVHMGVWCLVINSMVCGVLANQGICMVWNVATIFNI